MNTRTILIITLMACLMFLPVVSATIVQDNSTASFPSNTVVGGSAGQGMKFVVNNACYSGNSCYLVNFTAGSMSDGNVWYLFNTSSGSRVLLATGTVFNATTYTYGVSDIRLYKGTIYDLILNRTTGSQRIGYRTASASVTGVYINYTTSDDNGADDGANIRNILSITTSNVSSIIPNVSITLTDFYTGTSISNFSATALNGSGYQYNGTTTIGTLNDWTYTFSTADASLWNITLTSTENGGYFSKTLLNQNVSSPIINTLAQSDITFYGVEKVTNNNISGVTFSTQYLSNTTHYMRVQSYVVNSSKSGYYNATMTYTPTALLTATVPFYNISNQSLNLTVRYLLNNSAVPSFTVYVANSTYGFNEYYSVTGSQITLNLTSNIGYTISVNVTNAFSNTTSFISAYNQSNLTVYVASTTQLNVFFFDEETLQSVSNVNYTVVGSIYALNGTTSNNNINFTALSNDNYEIRYTQNGGNYTSRSYFIRIPLTTASESNISLYLLKVNSSTTFTLYVTDKYDLPKPNLTVSLLRRYPINGQTVYYVVEQMKPSYALDGQTIFNGVANNVPYLFRVVNDEGNVVFQGSGSTANNLQTLYLISNPIYIRVTLDTNPFTIAQDLEGVSANLSNTSTAFWYNVQDTNNALDQICLKVIGNTSLQVYNYCSDDTSSILSYVPSNGNNLSYYTAYGYVIIDGVQRVLKTAQIDFRTNNSFRIYGNFGIFLTLLSIIIVSVAFADKPMFMVIGIALSLLAFGTQALGFIWLSPTLQATILVLSLIVAYIMRND